MEDDRARTRTTRERQRTVRTRVAQEAEVAGAPTRSSRPAPLSPTPVGWAADADDRAGTTTGKGARRRRRAARRRREREAERIRLHRPPRPDAAPEPRTQRADEGHPGNIDMPRLDEQPGPQPPPPGTVCEELEAMCTEAVEYITSEEMLEAIEAARQAEARRGAPTRPEGRTPSASARGSAGGPTHAPAGRGEEARGAGWRTSLYADGHHVFIRLPRELRPREDGGVGEVTVTTRGIIHTLEKGLQMGMGEIACAQRHDRSSWLAKFRDPAYARGADGVECAYAGGPAPRRYTVQIALCRGAGAQVFIAAGTNHAPPRVMIEEIGRRLTEMELGAMDFWLGLQSYRGARGAAAVLWLSQPPEVSEISVYFPDVGGKRDQLLGRFMAARLSRTACEICEQEAPATPQGTPHAILLCPDLTSASPAPPTPPRNWLRALPCSALSFEWVASP